MLSLFVLSISFPQYLHEGAEGSASSAQLQGPQLSHPQREIPGTVLLYMLRPCHCCVQLVGIL